MKKLVIVGEFDSDNVGDQLIGEGQRILFTREGWEVTMTPLEPPGRLAAVAPDTPDSQTAVGIRALHRRFYRDSILYRHLTEAMLFVKDRGKYSARAQEIVSGADLVMIGGGQLLSDGTLRMIKRLLDLGALSGRNSVPFVAFGTGVSQPRTFISGFLLRAVLRKLSSKSWFRDQRSISIARNFHPNGFFSDQPVPDCAIAEIASFVRVGDECNDPELVGLAPMATSSLVLSSHDSVGSDTWWAEAASEVAARGLRPILFCTGTASDYQRCLQVQSLCATSGLSVEVLPRPNNSKELLAVMAAMGFMLGQRLHGSISFYSLGNVPVTLIWDEKVIQFFVMIGCQDRVIDPTNTNPKAAVEILLKRHAPSTCPSALVELSKTMARQCISAASQSGGSLGG